MAQIDILIPTCRRNRLAVVLASLFGQIFTDFDVVISYQSPTMRSI
jgi:hypothetical protein